MLRRSCRRLSMVMTVNSRMQQMGLKMNLTCISARIYIYIYIWCCRRCGFCIPDWAIAVVAIAAKMNELLENIILIDIMFENILKWSGWYYCMGWIGVRVVL